MVSYVGGDPPRLYPAVITAVHFPTVDVQLTDDADTDAAPSTITATGTGTVGDKVTVIIQPSGRAILIRS